MKMMAFWELFADVDPKFLPVNLDTVWEKPFVVPMFNSWIVIFAILDVFLPRVHR